MFLHEPFIFLSILYIIWPIKQNTSTLCSLLHCDYKRMILKRWRSLNNQFNLIKDLYEFWILINWWLYFMSKTPWMECWLKYPFCANVACPPIQIFSYYVFIPLINSFVQNIDSPYRTHINVAMLKMQEDGRLQRLKDKWWKDNSKGIETKLHQSKFYFLTL